MIKSNEFLERVPSLTKEKLITQEKVLQRSAEYERDKEKLKRALSSRSKKPAGQLLMTKSEMYRQEKELREKTETSRPLDERYGNHTWYMSLRRPRDFTGTRFVNVNIGTQEHPIWRVVKEFVGKDPERIRKPASGFPKGTTYLTIGSKKLLVTGPTDMFNDLEVI